MSTSIEHLLIERMKTDGLASLGTDEVGVPEGAFPLAALGEGVAHRIALWAILIRGNLSPAARARKEVGRFGGLDAVPASIGAQSAVPHGDRRVHR